MKRLQSTGKYLFFIIAILAIPALVFPTQIRQIITNWGSIQGTLSNQTDLQNALNGKQASGNYAQSGANSDITGLTGLSGALGSGAPGTANQIQINNGSGGFGASTCTADGSGNLNCSGTATLGTIYGTFSDYQDIPIDAALDSPLGGAGAAKVIAGSVGSVMTSTPANVSYGTFTASGANVTTAVYVSGTQTSTLTESGLTVGRLYLLQFTPTVTGQVPTITVTSGVAQNSPLVTIMSTVQQQIWFAASATSAVFTFSNTAASTWSTASTTCYSYTRPVTVRDYSNSVMQSEVFPWLPPKDWNAGTVVIQPYFNFDAATPPTNTQTTIWQFEGYCIADGASQAQSVGTSQTSTYTSSGTSYQYQWGVGPACSALTLPGAAAGAKCYIQVDRLINGTYAQPVGFGNILIKFSRTVAQ